MDSKQNTGDKTPGFGIKDLIYIIIFLSVLCVVLFTVNVAYDAELSAYVQFASSLGSVILAIVALIYSISQGILNQATNASVVESTTLLREKTL